MSKKHTHKVGHFVPYQYHTEIPRIIVKKVLVRDPTGGLSTEELANRSCAFAYEDGYADGRDYGPDGKWVAGHYNKQALTEYLAGFTAGCRVRASTVLSNAS